MRNTSDFQPKPWYGPSGNLLLLGTIIEILRVRHPLDAGVGAGVGAQMLSASQPISP